ncbi:MAG TPA: TonB family protein [Bacteroidales bacterium]|nr:TonB family protein [Bacteroidales bacterium]
MKAFLILVVFLFLGALTYGQQTGSAQDQSPYTVAIDYQKGQPNFPGGDDALQKFIRDNLHFPDSINRLNVSCKIYVSFTVDTTGSVTNVKLLKGVNKVIDAEVLRVVSILPKWMPAVVKGKKSAMMIAMPVTVNTGVREE